MEASTFLYSASVSRAVAAAAVKFLNTPPTRSPMVFWALVKFALFLPSQNDPPFRNRRAGQQPWRVMEYRLDRLSRDLRHSVNLGQELREHKVGLTVVAAPELGVAALGNLMLNVLASFVEPEREMTSSRIAGAVPFGYAAGLARSSWSWFREKAKYFRGFFSGH